VRGEREISGHRENLQGAIFRHPLPLRRRNGAGVLYDRDSVSAEQYAPFTRSPPSMVIGPVFRLGFVARLFHADPLAMIARSPARALHGMLHKCCMSRWP